MNFQDTVLTGKDPFLKMKTRLDDIYARYNRPEFIDPDPLLFLYDYPDTQDREVAGLIAASFAYGQVSQIMKTVGFVLSKMKPSPRLYIQTRSRKEMGRDFQGFVYRFDRENHLVALLMGIKNTLTAFQTLEDCFCSGMSATDETVIPGLIRLYRHLDPDRQTGHLLADPEKSSACKRSHLFLRWMIRCDDVDPGGWEKINPSKLIIPVDLHIHRIGRLLGLTRRKSADLKTALEITGGFRCMVPMDPVKYDFCLSRYGIRNELTLEDLKQKVYN